MEQAVNTFQKGLNTDSHPMAQSNDRLTDALNATFVTQNGNEIILQNDMGNRRIDNAFLPSGYQPVGMKEYGGIIYVAAYNPITNKSQIGSFPSPERKIGTESGLGYNDNKTELNQFFSYTQDNEEKIKFLKSDFVLLPLTEKQNNSISMHTGDKFIVYSDDLNPDLISNYNNTEDDLVISPKNKKFTLSLGILNSQNEFNDITSSMKRWNKIDNKWSIAEIDDKSNLYKFNYGYFIPQYDKESYKKLLTSKDETFKKERESMPVNTYSYKLVGPLYLKVQLNHITNITYTIYGEKLSDNVAKSITVETTITYNCPDGVTKGTLINDLYKYLGTYGEGTSIQYIGFDLLRKNQDNSYSLIDSTVIPEIIDECTYDYDSNLYTVTLSKTYRNVLATNNNILEYYLCINSGLEDEVYLEDLSQKGELDLSLLNSGTIKVDGWRFFNTVEEKQTSLTYSLETYPKRNQEFKDLVLKLTPYTLEGLSDESIYYILENDISAGRNTSIIYWDQARKESGTEDSEQYYDWESGQIRPYSSLFSNTLTSIEPRKLYKVELYYRYTENGNLRINYTRVNEDSLWLLTTELLNNCYLYTGEEFVHNYCNPTEEEKSIINKYLTIRPYDYYNFTESGKITTEYDGSLIYPIGAENGEFKYKYTYEGVINPNIKYDNELYPDCIKVTKVPVPKLDKQQRYNGLIRYDKSNNLKYIYKWEDSIQGDQFNTEGNITGLFKVISSISTDLNLNKFDNFQIGVATHPESGHRDYHTLLVRYFPLYNSRFGGNLTSSEVEWTIVDNKKIDGATRYLFSQYEEDLIKYIPVQYLFAYGKGKPTFIADDEKKYTRNMYFGKEPFKQDNTHNSEIYTRLWWKTQDGTYALYKKILNDNNIENTIKGIIQDLAYRVQEFSTFQDAGIKTLNINKSTISDRQSKSFNLKLIYDGDFQIKDGSEKFIISSSQREDYLTPTFESSDVFYEVLESFDERNLENIFISDKGVILDQDYAMSKLDSRKVYEFKNNVLKEVKDFLMSTEISLDSNGTYNGIVVNNQTKSSNIEYPYDNAESDHDDQLNTLYYDKVYVVSDTFTVNETKGYSENTIYGGSSENSGSNSIQGGSRSGSNSGNTGFGGRG